MICKVMTGAAKVALGIIMVGALFETISILRIKRSNEIDWERAS